jgi:glycosyltransferase involved in cell wall biosynthesis
MKIAIDARIISSETGRYVRELIANLAHIDTANEYLVLLRTQDLQDFTPPNPRFQAVEAEFKNYGFAEQIGLHRLLKQLKPDLVHFCMPQQPLLYTKAAVTTIHDLNLLRITANDDMNWLELRIKKIVFAALLWIVARRSAHIIVPSTYTKQDLQRFSGVMSDKITVTYEGAMQPTAAPKAVPAYQSVPFIMYVGRAEPYKNNRGLIEAHQLLLTKFPELRLAIVGKKDALRQADMAWVEKRGYKNVDFTGFLSDEELAWLYANARAYVQPSFMEGFGLPGLEAMANGAAVVSSDTTCLPEIYGDAALYCNPKDTADIAKSIEEVVAHDMVRQRLIASGAEQIKKYSWQRMAEQTLVVYAKALSLGPSSSRTD